MAKKLMPKINLDECVGCEACVTDCEGQALAMVDDKAKLVKPEACTSCKKCSENCPSEAIKMEEQNA